MGAAIGWALGSVTGSKGGTMRIEDVLVGVFGAFIGGEFVSTLLQGAKAAQTFGFKGLLAAVGTAVAMLLLLNLMRKAVGPLRSKKSPARCR